jgi:hypothetical protein
VKVPLLRTSIPMKESWNVWKQLLRVVALLTMLAATFALAQESPQQIDSPGAGADGGGSVGSSGGGGKHVSAGVASRWGVSASTGAASTWTPARNGSRSSGFVAGAGASHPLASVPDHPVSAGSVSSPKVATREVHPGGGGMRAAPKAAGGPGETTGAKSQFAFSGSSHGTASYGNGGRKASARLIADQIKQHSPSGRHSGGRHRHKAKPSHKDAEPLAPKGQKDCEKASTLELCLWL